EQQKTTICTAVCGKALHCCTPTGVTSYLCRPMNLITLESVSLSYGEKILLNSIDFRVNQGDRIALIAQNGSGKSTLMKIMCGLVAPEGEQARVLTAPGIRIGYLDQEPEFEADMAIRDVLMGIDHP